jgi:hypothetical protein
MASGCASVVHKSGGSWTDTPVNNEIYGFSYSTQQEAAEYIDMLLTHEDLSIKIASRASQRA